VALTRFSKYQGLGNDYIIVQDLPARLRPEAVRAHCDRHFGVGADGIIAIGKPTSPSAAAKIAVFNADGSCAETSGNGLRCVAVYLARREGRDEMDLAIETDAGLLSCRVRGEQVEIDMGRLVEHGPVEVPFGGRVFDFVSMSIGNPHAITFDPVDAQEIDHVGSTVSVLPTFASGTNVEFGRLADDGGIDLVVWERGVGRTLACGTGACATAAVACLEKKRPFGKFFTVRLPGGPLEVCVQQRPLSAIMRGPAHQVFDGEVDFPGSGL
jgi:diaminopimelate epimerase